MEHRHSKNHHNPAPGEDQKEFFDKLAGEWDTITIHDEKKVRYIVSLLGLNGNEEILDVGTGTGVMIPFYGEHLRGGSVLAVDFSERMISVCREKYPLSEYPKVIFEVADIYDLTNDDEFDIVMCYSCFPHFADHQRAIDIFTKALRCNGKIAIAHSSSRDHINHIHSHSSHHIQEDVLPSLEELGSMFLKAGLSVIFERSDDDYHIIIGEKR
ncbi:MAG: class I SAM-dependent methyltransferase [Methanomassiliicoccaceae archaeon]|nr:class I SAM-dependent methyltransferase [Methanomassiliicoccaceae archaeon]